MKGVDWAGVGISADLCRLVMRSRRCCTWTSTRKSSGLTPRSRREATRCAQRSWSSTAARLFSVGRTTPLLQMKRATLHSE